jgi:hypothetical protein
MKLKNPQAEKITWGTGRTSTGGKEENNEQQESKSTMAQRQNHEVE